MYEDSRNPMKPSDVTVDTPFEIEFTHKAPSWYGKQKGFRPTSAYVVAIKPCGCTGPSLGRIETVPPPVPHREITYLPGPRTWKPSEHGYELRQETKGRVGLYLNGERLFGKLTYGAEGNDKALRRILQPLSYNHYRHAVIENERPRNPDGRLCLTLKEALVYRPRAQAKLWAVYPDRPYRYNSKPKPFGYVWGKEAAAKALHAYWVAKNIAVDRTYVAVPDGTARIEQSDHHMFGMGN